MISFTAAGSMTTYRFNSKPNYFRIIDEARADGILASVVFVGGEPDTLLVLSANEIGTYDRRETGAIIQAIRDEIAEKYPLAVETEKPEHYDGEPCELPVCDCEGCLHAAAGLKFQYYTKGRKRKGDWFVDIFGNIARACDTDIANGGESWILRAVKDMEVAG